MASLCDQCKCLAVKLTRALNKFSPTTRVGLLTERPRTSSIDLGFKGGRPIANRLALVIGCSDTGSRGNTSRLDDTDGRSLALGLMG